jgi:hypothetical protein
MAGGDQARVSVRVNVPVDDAFDLFTREIGCNSPGAT